MILYLDPPYQGSTAYGHYGDTFNTKEFIAAIERWKLQFELPIFVSEYNFPLGSIAWEFETITRLDVDIKNSKRVERLYLV